MKNESNLVYTHKVNWGDNYLFLDVDFHHSSINGIKYQGNFSEADLLQIEQLEKKVTNFPIANISSELKENLGLNISSFLLLKFYQDFFGVIEVSAKQDVVCLCFGVTKKQILDFCQTQKNSDFFGDLMSELQITTKCGGCLQRVQDIYIEQAMNIRPSEPLQTFPEFRNKNYSEIIFEIDLILKDFLKSKNLNEFSATIKNIKNFELELKVIDDNFLTQYNLELTKLVFKQTGLVVFFQY